jgi:hypothetical protein
MSEITVTEATSTEATSTEATSTSSTKKEKTGIKYLGHLRSSVAKRPGSAVDVLMRELCRASAKGQFCDLSAVAHANGINPGRIQWVTTAYMRGMQHHDAKGKYAIWCCMELDTKEVGNEVHALAKIISVRAMTRAEAKQWGWKSYPTGSGEYDPRTDATDNTVWRDTETDSKASSTPMESKSEN